MEALPTCSGARVTEDFCISLYYIQSTQSLNLTRASEGENDKL